MGFGPAARQLVQLANLPVRRPCIAIKAELVALVIYAVVSGMQLIFTAFCIDMKVDTQTSCIVAASIYMQLPNCGV